MAGPWGWGENVCLKCDGKTTLHNNKGETLQAQKIQFEWELPDALVDAIARDKAQVAEIIKQAAVLDWVRTHKLSLRHGAELLQMTYRAFLDLMAAHRIPSVDYEEEWLERELDHRYFQPILTISQVYEEVITQGKNRPSAQELATACESGDVRVMELSDLHTVDQAWHAQTRIP
jgi:hypothetical protein